MFTIKANVTRHPAITAKASQRLFNFCIGCVLALMILPLQAAPVTYDHDANGNIIRRGDVSYTYDALDRIVTETRAGITTTYSYDNNGNRLSDNTGNYTYLANTNRMQTWHGVSVTLDADGNLTNAGGGRTYVYNQAGQLSQVKQNGVLLATYIYNHNNQRTRKITTASAPQGAKTVVYHYDQNGQLSAETTDTGIPLRTYVWHDAIPVAQIEHQPIDKVLYFNVDHLNTPRSATDATGTMVWSWESDAFGTTPALEDPDGDGNITTINLRFPGQYYDRESGLFYNLNRYYDPSIGRYLTSDPIGLGGGVNTFAYVGNNPLNQSDSLGLDSWTFGYFPGAGAQVTFGQNPNGSGFMSVQFGWGIGGGISYNPLGQQPGYFPSQGNSWGLGLGLYGQAGFRAGPIGANIGANVGRNYMSCGDYVYGGLTDNGSVRASSSWGIAASISGGGQVTIFGGGTHQ